MCGEGGGGGGGKGRRCEGETTHRELHSNSHVYHTISHDHFQLSLQPHSPPLCEKITQWDYLLLTVSVKSSSL